MKDRHRRVRDALYKLRYDPHLRDSDAWIDRSELWASGMIAPNSLGVPMTLEGITSALRYLVQKGAAEEKIRNGRRVYRITGRGRWQRVAEQERMQRKLESERRAEPRPTQPRRTAGES